MADTQEYERRLGLLVEALKSEGFEQARGRLLRVTEGSCAFCALGVACEVYRRETGNGEWGMVQVDPDRYSFFVDSQNWASDYLPKEVVEWYGFQSDVGHFAANRDLHAILTDDEDLDLSLVNPLDHDLTESVANVNDIYRLPLPRIGDLLAAKPPGLFSWGYDVVDTELLLEH